jgi:acylphosphatase
MMTGPVAFKAKIVGRVQGVGFRWAAAEAARHLGALGWVRNHEDGGVEAHVEGTAAVCESMREFLKRGPPGARVDLLDWQSAGPPQGYKEFAIRH